MATPDVLCRDARFRQRQCPKRALKPDILEARSMVLDTYRNAPDAKVTRTWVWVNGRAFLKDDFPTLHQFVLGILAIPATAADYERTFSSGRKLISPERNRLSDDIIEATECLKAWWDSGIIKQLA
jgi:hypothetical protein